MFGGVSVPARNSTYQSRPCPRRIRACERLIEQKACLISVEVYELQTVELGKLPFYGRKG